MAKAKQEAGKWNDAVLATGQSCDMEFPDAAFSIMPSGGQVEANGEVKQPNAPFQCGPGPVKFVALSNVSLEVRRLEPTQQQ